MIYVVAALFVVMTIMLLTGHGSWLIAGYNAMSKEEQEKYDVKRLCRGMGVGMGVITIMILIMCFLEHQLPSYFIYIFVVVVIVDVVAMIIWGNIFGKKK